jgi:hypothetical protein
MTCPSEQSVLLKKNGTFMPTATALMTTKGRSWIEEFSRNGWWAVLAFRWTCTQRSMDMVAVVRMLAVTNMFPNGRPMNTSKTPLTHCSVELLEGTHRNGPRGEIKRSDKRSHTAKKRRKENVCDFSEQLWKTIRLRMLRTIPETVSVGCT